MAIACPVDLVSGRLRHEIQAIYARVATDPSSACHFHRGPAYATERLGYDARARGEVFRILKPSGQFLYADIIVASELSESIRRDIDLWTG